MTPTRIAGGRMLIDGALQRGRSLLLAEGRIAALDPPEGGAATTRLPEDWVLAPGFIDVQVNGGGGVQFNATPTAAGIATIVAAHRRFGTTGLLPTFITDAPGGMQRAADAVAGAMRPGSGVLGLHLEGPFLSPARPGVHPPEHLRRITAADIDFLAGLPGRLGGGRLVLTLAPEEVPPEALARLAAAGVLLCAGHSEAAPAQLAGLRGVTHLFNAMPPMAARAPGPAAAALQDESLWAGLIADGIHVDPAMLRLAARCKPGRLMLVTDAMAPLGTEGTSFTLVGRSVRRANGRLQTADGTLAGADLDMAAAVRNAVALMRVTPERALEMASASPASFLGMEAERGRIAPGLAADLVLLDAALAVRGTFVAGDYAAATSAGGR